MSKRILSIALVVVMVMSMFAISASALTTGQIGLVVTSDAKVGMKAGDIVTVSFAYDIPDGEDVQLTAHNISLGYDNTAFSYIKESFAYSDTYVGYFKAVQNTTCNGASTISNNIVKKFNDADTANGWNAGVQVMQAYDVSSEYTQKTGYPAHDGEVVWTLQFNVLKDITAADTIGIVTGAIGNGTFVNPKQFTTTTSAGVLYTADNVDVSASKSVPVEAAAKVTHRATQIQWADASKTTANLGFKGEFAAADLGIAFDANGTSTNVTEVGAKVTINDVSQTKSARFVHEYETGKYEFRAILGGVDVTDTTEIKVEYYVIMDGTTYWSDAVTTTAAANAGRLPA